MNVSNWRGPRRAVAGVVAVELGDVRLQRRLEEHRLAVGERRRRRQVGVDVLEPARVEVVRELRVGGGPLEERMPRAEHLVGEAGQRVVLDRPDRTAQALVPLEHADAPALAREQRGPGQRVDPRPDEDGVVRGHGATLHRGRRA